MSTLTVHCQWEDETDHPPSYAEAKKMKSLTLHTHGCLRVSLRDSSSSLLLSEQLERRTNEELLPLESLGWYAVGLIRVDQWWTYAAKLALQLPESQCCLPKSSQAKQWPIHLMMVHHHFNFEALSNYSCIVIHGALRQQFCGHLLGGPQARPNIYLISDKIKQTDKLWQFFSFKSPESKK